MKKVVALAPTITTDDPHVYREQIERIAGFAEGIHLDFTDGEFAPTKTLHVSEAWRRDDLITHLHVMYQKPLKDIDAIIELGADLVILHAEADDVKQCLDVLSENGVRAGLALLHETSLDDLKKLDVDGLFEHVLVFGGKLGYQGGTADLAMLDKVREVSLAYPDAEIGWDGGVNDTNAKQIADAGVDVLNVGGYFKNAEDPQKAMADLRAKLES